MATNPLLGRNGSANATNDELDSLSTPMGPQGSHMDQAIARAEAAAVRLGPAAHEIMVHRAVKLTRDRSFNASGSFVHFSHHGLHNVIDDRSFLEAGSVRNFRRRARWYDTPYCIQLRKCIRSKIFVSLSMAALMVALFFPDLFVLLQVATNNELDAILMTAFSLFLLELLLHCASDPSYPFSFIFFMDLLGTLSMGFDISFAFGPDATVPERYKENNNNDAQFMIFRAARAARLAARAGRLSRVVKVLRFLSSSEDEDVQQVKMAKVISNKLSDVLSIRVAFLTICIAVVLPTFQMFEYPEVDESMIAWTQMITSDVADYQNAMDSHLGPGGAAGFQTRLEKTIQRFGGFYDKTFYGPFKVCIGEEHGEEFKCHHSALNLTLYNKFGVPDRLASILELTEGNVQVSYDMTNPRRAEAGMNILLIAFLIVGMVVFSVWLSSQIATIALTPLERMLSVVRQRCKQIFKYTNDLQEDENGDHVEEEELDDPKASEFALLEKAVSKLVAIAALTTKPVVMDEAEMDEHRAVVMGWAQGGQAPKQLPKAEDAKGKPGLSKGTTTRLTYGTQDNDTSHLMTAVKTIPQSVKKSLNTHYFDSLVPNKEQKIDLAAYIVYTLQGCSDYIQDICQEEVMMRFVKQAEGMYPPNPYHNFAHALDVEHALAMSFQLVDAGSFFTEAQQFWLSIAAIGHDLGHVALNNTFLIETEHELAVMYNDKSPLENMHCSKLFHILGNEDANVFAHVDKVEYKEMRRGIIQAILHTDTVKHNEMVKELALLYQMHSQALENDEQGPAVLAEHGQMMANALLHCADIGNPMKPWELCHKIAYLILDEFALQGDKEKELGIPVSHLNDREKLNRASSQVTLAEFMIVPMVEAIVHIFPTLDLLAMHLSKNVQKWEKMWITAESPAEDAAEKLQQRVDKISRKCEALVRSGQTFDDP